MSVSTFDPYRNSIFAAPYFNDKRKIKEIEEAVALFYQFVGGVGDEDLVFNSSQAESITQVFHSAYHNHMLATGKNQILIANIEDAPTLMNGELYEEMGCSIEYIPVASDGKITPEILNLYTSEKSAILFISYSNALTGVIQPIEQIAQFCQKHDILLHVNMSDAMGKVYFRFDEHPIDFLSFDRVLIAKKKKSLKALIPSTSSVNPLRGGDFDYEGLINYANQLREVMEDQSAIGLRLTRLRNLFESHFDRVLFSDQMRVPHLSSVMFEGFGADLLLYYLCEEGITASMGGNGVQKLEHLLTKCGFDAVQARSSLSFGFTSSMREEEIEKAVTVIKKCVKKLEPLRMEYEVL